MARTKVQVTESKIDDRETKQFRVTIPRDLAEFFSLKQGDELEWGSGRASNKMEVTIHRSDE